MPSFLKLLVFLVFSASLNAEAINWDSLRDLVYSDDAKQHSSGIKELARLVDFHVEEESDNLALRKILYDLLDDDREIEKISSDEYTWQPKVTASMLLIKLTGYVQDPVVIDDSLPPVDEAFQIASSEQKNAKFKAWYEKRYDLHTHERIIQTRPAGALSNGGRPSSQNTRHSEREVGVESKDEKSESWLSIVGVLVLSLLLGIGYLFLRTKAAK